MSVSVNTSVAGGAAGSGGIQPANVNVVVAGGVAGGGASPSLDFSDPNNSMYAVYFSIGVGVN